MDTTVNQNTTVNNNTTGQTNTAKTVANQTEQIKSAIKQPATAKTAVNQNDIVEIVKSQVNAITNVIGVIINAASNKNILLYQSSEIQVRNFKNTIQSAFGEKGVIHAIISEFERMYKANSSETLPSTLETISGLTTSITKIAELVKSTQSITDALSKFKRIRWMKYKIRVIMRFLNRLIDITKRINILCQKYNDIATSVEVLPKLLKNLTDIIKLYGQFREMSMIILLKIKMDNFIKFIDYLTIIPEHLKKLDVNQLLIVQLDTMRRILKIITSIALFVVVNNPIIRLSTVMIRSYLAGLLTIVKLLSEFADNAERYNIKRTTIIIGRLNKLFLSLIVASLALITLALFTIVIMRLIKYIIQFLIVLPVIAMWTLIVFKIVHMLFKYMAHIAKDLVVIGLCTIVLKYMWSHILLFFISMKAITGLLIMLCMVLNTGSRLFKWRHFFRLYLAIKRLRRITKKLIALGLLALIANGIMRAVITFLSRLVSLVLQLVVLGGFIKLLKRLVRRLFRFLFIIRELSIIAGTIIILGLKSLLAILAIMSIMIFLNKLIMMITTLIYLGRIMRLKKFNKRIIRLIIAIIKLTTLTGLIITLGLKSILAIIAIPIVLLFLFGLVILVTVIVLLNNILGVLRHFTKNMKRLMIVIFELVIIAGLLFLLSFIVMKIVNNIWYIIGFLIGLIIIVGLIAVMGGILTTILPVLIIASVVFLVLFAIIGLIYLMALMLNDLSRLKLNRKGVLKSVQLVIRTALDIIDSLFKRDEKQSEEAKTPWYRKVLKWIGGGVASLIEIILAVAFLATAVVAVGLIMFLAVQLRLLQTLDLKDGLIKTNVETVIKTALGVIDCLFGRDEVKSKESETPWYGKVLKWIGGGIGGIIEAILAVAFLATAVVAIGLIMALAIQLRILQTLDLKDGLIKTNVETVIKTALGVIDCLFGRDEIKSKESETPWYEKVLKWIGGGVVSVIEAILAIGFLATAVVAVGLITLLAKQLKIIQNIQLEDDIIAKKVETVITSAQKVCSIISMPDNSKPSKPKGFIKSLLGWVAPGLSNMMDAISSIGFLSLSVVAVGIVHKLAKQLVSIQNTPNLSRVQDKVDSILQTSKNVIDSIFADDGKGGNLASRIEKNKKSIRSAYSTLRVINDMINNITKITPEQAKETDKTITSYIKFIDKVNEAKVENLKTTAQLFKQMAEFSKSINGDFTRLADTLNEKIGPTLEELKTLMEGIPKQISDSSASISSSIYATTPGGMNTLDDHVAQVLRERPLADKEEVNNLADRRLTAQTAEQNNGILAKLEELIDLLTSQRGIVVRME